MSNPFTIEARWNYGMARGNHLNDTVKVTMALLFGTAAILALKEIKEPCEIILYTDSKYVLQGIEEWIHNWKKRGWRGANKKPVKNIELWKELDELRDEHNIKWNWVKGHSGDPGNETADMLANRGIDEL